MTEITDLLFSEVAPLVISHVALGPEAFSAPLRAREWTFVFVNSLMNLQVLLLAKSLATVRKSTFEWLSAVVEVHMGTEADLSGELLLTAWEGAGKHGLTISVYLTRNRFFFSRLVQRGSFRLALLHGHIHRVRKACLSRCALLENATVT